MSTPFAQTNRLFVSYAHADNNLFDDAVASFVRDLQGFYAAKTGNELSVFFDRESIGWGEEWREAIDTELRNASIFMPIITMQYFNRPACRDELNAFHGSAGRLNARYLILPVVISGAKSISADHPIPEVATIESLQHRNLEDVFIAGPGTGEWRRAISDLTDELISIISKAEAAMTETAASEAQVPEMSGFDEDDDFLETVAEIEALTPQMESELTQALTDLQVWSEVATESMEGFGPGKSTQQLRAASMLMADRIREPSKQLQKSGIRLAASAEVADAAMSALVRQISQVQAPEAKEMAQKIVVSTKSGSSELRTVTQQMSEFLNMLTLIELMSAPLRKAIKPARIGITKIQDAVRVVDRWGSLPDL
ncbi:TIR domain-containing protein [Streptomyces sp. NPDC101171]|uniref:TIR domain-containing protein n=1 Tax=Streptomyces sp. NPDC101171 TaxID=3366122 RepID=UPI003818BD58